jgi:23S rRNA pseudouridine2605 synthase
MVNKPVGVLSAVRRGLEEGALITQLVDVGTRIFPVGRLDRDSEGLLLLTNDGDLALKLTHPRYEREKEYEVSLNRPFDLARTNRLVRGVSVDGVRMRAVRVRPLLTDKKKEEKTSIHSLHSTLRIVLTQGHKRQIRRMFSALGFKVVRLRRVRIAGLELGDLEPGAWRQLTPAEVESRLLPPGSHKHPVETNPHTRILGKSSPGRRPSPVKPMSSAGKN